MNLVPTKLERLSDRELVIHWSDGQKRRYDVRDLRDACPCATCRENRKQKEEKSAMLPVLTEAELQPLTIRGMKPVGNYAYAIAFSDGHDTGIFTLELLRQLGTPVND